MAVLLLLGLKLLVISPGLWRLVWLSHGWRINHVVLWWSTAGTTSGGSRLRPLPLLFLCCLTGLHGALLINGSAG
jgi:hypothetical protein